MRDWSTLIEELAESTGRRPSTFRVGRSVGGGSINQAVVVDGGDTRYFAKYNHPSRLQMFAAEAEGLKAMADAGAVRVPTPICWGAGSNIAFLVLEYLDLAPGNGHTQARLGEQLAALHGISQKQFGWHRDNTIGTTPQANQYSSNWSEFFRDRRLGYQLELAARGGNHTLQSSGERLLARMDSFFENYNPVPSLLHGDLWAGNVGETTSGEPVLFDPAVYFGDRETDLAMTELFGGFSKSFYRHYEEIWPLDSGYVMRKPLYNLYHVLNHLNLFGGSYLVQAERTIAELLALV